MMFSRFMMTKMAPADIFVLYPGKGFEQYLASSFFIRIEGAELGTKADGIIILVLSAASGWAIPITGQQQPGDLDTKQSCDFFQSGTEAMARAMVRREVNVRTASILYTARRVLERRKVFLIGLLGTVEVMFNTNDIAHTVEKFLWLLFHGKAYSNLFGQAGR